MSRGAERQKSQNSSQTVQFFEALLRASGDGILVTDASQNIILTNEAFSAFFGTTVPEMVETCVFVWLDKLDKGAHQRWSKLEQQVLAKGTCPNVEFQASSGHGVRYFSVNSSRLDRIATEDRGVLISIWREVTETRVAEKELAGYRDHLQELVSQRTTKLQQEIAERERIEKALLEVDQRYKLATSVGKVGVWDWDLETDEIYFDPHLKAILGYEDHEIPNHRDGVAKLVNPDDWDEMEARLKVHIEERTSHWEVTHRKIHKDGSIYWFLTRGTAMLDENGKPYRVVGIDADITESKQAEAQIAASLKEKEVLLREIHHRVKNNMQVIVSLLRMRSRRSNDPQLEQVFNDCRDRINAMRLIHESLYQSDNLAQIKLEPYIRNLCANLGKAYDALSHGIKVAVERCDVRLNIDQSIAVGLVISELITNAFKHAFPQGKGGKVAVSLGSHDGKVELIVQDNGIGIPAEIDIQQVSSLGLQLAVATVTRELGGSIKVERNSGTRFVFRFTARAH